MVPIFVLINMWTIFRTDSVAIYSLMAFRSRTICSNIKYFILHPSKWSKEHLWTSVSMWIVPFQPRLNRKEQHFTVQYIDFNLLQWFQTCDRWRDDTLRTYYVFVRVSMCVCVRFKFQRDYRANICDYVVNSQAVKISVSKNYYHL
jgi:hypothetical protein